MTKSPEEYKKEIMRLRTVIASLHVEISKILDEIFGEGNGQWHDVDAFWGCDSSPIGWCVYHNYADPAHDSCVFCGEPQERK